MAFLARHQAIDTHTAYRKLFRREFGKILQVPSGSDRSWGQRRRYNCRKVAIGLSCSAGSHGHKLSIAVCYASGFHYLEMPIMTILRFIAHADKRQQLFPRLKSKLEHLIILAWCCGSSLARLGMLTLCQIERLLPMLISRSLVSMFAPGFVPV